MTDPSTKSRDFKDRVFTELERIGKALGSRRRLELLDLVSQGPHSSARGPIASRSWPTNSG